MTTLIIGYGNPLRADDGVGVYCIERLEGEPLPSSVRLLAVHQLTPELAEPISRADAVIFIDASTTLAPGELRIEEVRPVEVSAPAFTHHVTPASLLSMAQLLYGHCPRGALYSIGGQAWGYQQCLSPVVAAAAERLIMRLMVALSRPKPDYYPPFRMPGS